MITSILSFIACYLLYDNDFYTLSKDKVREKIMMSCAIDYCNDVYETYKNDRDNLNFYFDYINFFYIIMKKTVRLLLLIITVKQPHTLSL